MKERILFFPGLGEKPKNYKSFSKHLKIADIDWNTGKYTPKIKNEEILIGFSLGNCFPFEYALKKKVKTIIICSSTPFENLKGVKAEKMVFIAGSKEKFIIDNYKRVISTLPKKQKRELIIVNGSDHKIDKNYQKLILDIIKTNQF